MNILVLVPLSRFSKNVARDLIYGCWCKGKRIAGIKFPPISQLLIATILKNANHRVTLLDALVEQKTVEDVINIINSFDIVIVLTSTVTINEDSEFLRQLKIANSRLKTIVFGGHPTFMPKHTLQREGIDFIVRGEAEYVIRDFINAIEKGDNSWSEIQGIGYKYNGDAIINPFYPYIENLDLLPIPDRTMLPNWVDYFNPVVKRMSYTTMMTSRGCPGECIFCASPPFYGRKIRLQSAERVMEEIRLIVRQGYKEIFFRDENFTISKNRVVDICEQILKEGIDVTWICSTRIDYIALEMMKIMKMAGCHMVRLGVESGVQDILDNIKKGITIEQTREVFNWAHKVGLDTHAHCMIGMPGETQDTINKTLRFVKEIDPTIVTFGICTPYPGTPLFDMVREKHPEIGDGSQVDLGFLHTQGFYNEIFTDLTNERLSWNLRRIYRGFYLRPLYLLKWLGRIRTLDELKRVILAGTQVFGFALDRDS